MGKQSSSRSSRLPRRANPQTARTVATLLAWFAQAARDLPWRRTRDPYAIWVSEIMLQQTQVKTVIPYWERWLRELPTLQALAAASPAKIHKLWEGLGYYTRVRNLQKAAQQICATQPGTFPQSFAAILALPGIGRYTAGAIASIAFDQPAPILDGNVIRVLTRLHGIADDPREKATNARLWSLAGELVECAGGMRKHPAPCSHLNQALMELGALLCTPRSPNCAVCPLQDACFAWRAGRVAEFPRAKTRAAVTDRRFLAFIVERDGRFLVQQRSNGVVNAHLWEFPNVEVAADCPPARAARTWLGGKPRAVQKLLVVRHAITRYRVTTEAYRVEPTTGTSRALAGGQWHPPAQLHDLPFTAAHRRIVLALTRPGSGRD
jgi:A/G-specific adenine glycosylase